MRPDELLRSESASEVERLQRELRRVMTERDTLKKAGYFAKDRSEVRLYRSSPVRLDHTEMCLVMLRAYFAARTPDARDSKFGLKKRVCCYFHSSKPLLDGGADGTRTRDPRRDRPVF